MSGKTCVTEIDELQIDALKELGNVGASWASTALSKFAMKDMLIDVTQCHTEPLNKMPHWFDRPGETVAIITIDINGSDKDHILMLFPKNIITWLSDLLFGRAHDPARNLAEDDKDALVEMGDICIREYLNPISRFLGTDMMPTPPTVYIDIVGPQQSFPEWVLKTHADHQVWIETNFVDATKTFQGSIIFIPEKETQELTFKKFGVDTETQMAIFAKFGVSTIC
ncbi:MAG: chemotaxis protein CheC [Methanomassiliicoccales archaeon]